MAIKFESQHVRNKLTGRNITPEDLRQAAENRTHAPLEDDREEHRTDPPSKYFIAPTYSGRLLKIVFIVKNRDLVIKSAFEPSASQQKEYFDNAIKLPE